MVHATEPPGAAPNSSGPASWMRGTLARVRTWWRHLRWDDPKVRWTAYGTVALLSLTALGAALIWSGPGGDYDYIEVYIADAPADFEEIRICVEDVLVGDANHALRVLAPEFDLLAYRGTENPLLLAAGHVPNGVHTDVSILFCGARGSLAGEWIDIHIPNRHLRVGSGYDLGSSREHKAAVLIDVDLDQSIVLTGHGYEFRPHVSNLYYHDYGTRGKDKDIGQPGGALKSHGFSGAPSVTPSTRVTRTFHTTTPTNSLPTESCKAFCGGPGKPAAPPSIAASPGVSQVEIAWAVPQNGGSMITGYNVYRGETSEELTLLKSLGPTSKYIDPDVTNEVTYYYQVAAVNAVGEGGRSAQVHATPSEDPPPPPPPFDPLGLGEYGCGPQGNGAPTLCGVPDPEETLRWIIHFNLSQLGSDEFQENIEAQLEPTLEFLKTVRDKQGLPDPLDAPGSVLDPITGTVADLYQVAEMLWTNKKWNNGTVEGILTMEPALVLQATYDAAMQLCQETAVDGCEVERPVEYGSFSAAKEIVRWNQAQASYPYRGQGIGIGVVDSGIDATHPDLPYRVLPSDTNAVVLRNFKIGIFSIDDIPNTDQHGHGTHVAGIVAAQMNLAQGLGVPRQGQFGMAHGSKLYGWGLGQVPTTVTAALAYDHIVFMLEQDRLNDAVLEPDLRVLTNSWGIGTTHDPNLQVNKLMARAVRDYGVVVVVMAGNNGGNGVTAATTGQCQSPLEGIICVGGADDKGQSDRTQIGTYGWTSRGATANAATWPDLVAIATSIESTKPATTPNLEVSPAGQLQTISSPFFQTLTGTSQATPMVAACAALMLQANGSLVPSQVEYMLEQSAYKYGSGYAVDSDVRYNGSHYIKGHGLLDCHAAIGLARA